MMHQQPNWGSGGGARQVQPYGQQQQQQQQQPMYQQQQLYQQHIQQQQQQQQPTHYAAAAAAGGGGMMPPQHHQAIIGGAHQGAYMHQQQAMVPQPMQVLQPRLGRLPADRPVMKLSVGLIETYKEINKVSERCHRCVCACLFFVRACSRDSLNRKCSA